MSHYAEGLSDEAISAMLNQREENPEKGSDQCPRCKGPADHSCTLSRRDNATELCAACGNIEAYEDMGYAEPWTGKQYWGDKR